MGRSGSPEAVPELAFFVYRHMHLRLWELSPSITSLHHFGSEFDRTTTRTNAASHHHVEWTVKIKQTKAADCAAAAATKSTSSATVAGQHSKLQVLIWYMFLVF